VDHDNTIGRVNRRIQGKAGSVPVGPISSPLPGRYPAPPLKSPGHATPARALTPQHTLLHPSTSSKTSVHTPSWPRPSCRARPPKPSSCHPGVLSSPTQIQIRIVRGASVQTVKHALLSPLHPPAADTRQVLSLGPYYLDTYLCLSIASIASIRSSTLGPCSDRSTRRPASFARSIARGGWRTGPRTAVDRHFFFLLFFPSFLSFLSAHALSTCNIACLPPSTWRRHPLYLPFPSSLPTHLCNPASCRARAARPLSRLHPHIVALFAAPKRPCHMI
jgi:hypothetical protein